MVYGNSSSMFCVCFAVIINIHHSFLYFTTNINQFTVRAFDSGTWWVVVCRQKYTNHHEDRRGDRYDHIVGVVRPVPDVNYRARRHKLRVGANALRYRHNHDKRNGHQRGVVVPDTPDRFPRRQ
jgi:hypothetical protein